MRAGSPRCTVAFVAVCLLASCARSHAAASNSSLPPVSNTTTSSTTGSTEPTTTTGKPLPARTPLQCVDALPMRVRVGQMLMFSVEGANLDSAHHEFADPGIGGALLQDPGTAVTRDRIVGFRDAGPIPMFIAVDEEGGDVQRLAAKLGAIPSPSTVARTMSPAAAQVMIAAHAKLVAGLGVNVAFAPVVDVKPIGREGPIGDRAFSDDPAVVTSFGAAYVAAWEAAGVMPVLKHFPGHGSANGDTHTGLATVPPLSQLRERDLQPYFALARGASKIGVMVAHVDVPDFSNGPSSLSPPVYDLLRHDVGFRGVAFTDALTMGAITAGHSLAVAGVDALRAGADVALFTGSPDVSIVDAVLGAAGTTIPTAQIDASVLRILTAKKVDPCSLRF